MVDEAVLRSRQRGYGDLTVADSEAEWGNTIDWDGWEGWGRRIVPDFEGHGWISKN